MIPSSLSQSVEDEVFQEFAEDSFSLIKDKAV